MVFPRIVYTLQYNVFKRVVLCDQLIDAFNPIDASFIKPVNKINMEGKEASVAVMEAHPKPESLNLSSIEF